MMSTGVAMRQGATRSIWLTVLAAALAAAPALADIANEAGPSPAAPITGGDAAGDTAALLRILEAPGPSFATEETQGAGQNEIDSPVKNAPRTLDMLTLDEQAKCYDAWDIKGGTIVPEPATALLMGAGLAGIAAMRRRQGGTGTK